MTAIYYPDRTATSASGRFTLEARSPHNGTVPHHDGRPATDEEFGFKYREHQSNFRYRIIESVPVRLPSTPRPSDNGRVVWERWQGVGEDSPHELVVADD